jgi:phospholipase C
MKRTSFTSKAVQYLQLGLATLATFQFAIGAPFANAASQPTPQQSHDAATATPIKHVIVIIGENRSFDHVFATYVPKHGETVNNLLSEGIIALNGSKAAIPGPNFNNAQQFFATDTDSFLLTPPTQEYPSNILPAPLVGGPSLFHRPCSMSIVAETFPSAMCRSFRSRIADRSVCRLSQRRHRRKKIYAG